MNMEAMLEHPWFQCSYFLKFPMVHISPIQFNGQIHPPWTIETFKKMNMEAMLEHAWLQCSCFLNFPMIQISPIHSNGQLHPPWRHTNQEDDHTLCLYVFKAGELNHREIPSVKNDRGHFWSSSAVSNYALTSPCPRNCFTCLPSQTYSEARPPQ